VTRRSHGWHGLRCLHGLVRGAYTWLALLVAGCSFDAADKAGISNVCSVDEDCGADSRCSEGMCVGRTSNGLELSLVVTPMRMPNGSQSMPITVDTAPLGGRTQRNIDLPLPIATGGKLRNGSRRMAAELHFSPLLPEGLPVAAAQLVTTSGESREPATQDAAPDALDFSVQLLRGVRYRVVVEPTDRALPPYAQEITVGDNETISIDYSQVRWTVQRFFVQDAPTDRRLLMRAVDAQTGEPVSSTGTVTDRPTTLVFGPAPVAEYRLELTAEDSYATIATLGSVCDLSTPLLPVLRIAQSALKDDEAGTHVLIMPKIPEPIHYAGVVELCPGSSGSGLSGMPMALDARTLLLEGDAAIEASYNATTMAMLDPDSSELRFCARVLPGDYVVVVTPPVNVECEMYAERTRIETAVGGGVSDVKLALRRASVLRGTLQTPDRSPVGAASVEARALGRAFPGTDDEDRASVPTYNRSTQTATDEGGAFRLPLDLGSYDVVLKPAPDSGFAWHVLYDVEIDRPDDTFATKVVLDAPIAIDALLRYSAGNAAAQSTLASAEVQAYATLETLSGPRAIQVARGIADETGRVTLLISPTPQAGR
jgi:hypothetical protein